MDVLFEPQSQLIGDRLASFSKPLHLLNADLCEFHQAIYFFFTIVLKLQAEVFGPCLQAVQRFIG